MVITDATNRLDADHLRVALVPVGEIDACNVGELADSIHAALLAGALEVDIDLSQVPFMDTAALSALETARESLEIRGGYLCLRNPTPSVRRLLSLTAFATRG